MSRNKLKTFCYKKLFWASTVWINCSSDFKIFEISRPSASNFKKHSGLLERFFLIVGQNNFGNKIPFLSKSSILQSVPLDSFVHSVEICFSSFYYFPTLFYVSLPQILHWFSHPGPDQVTTYTTLMSLINTSRSFSCNKWKRIHPACFFSGNKWKNLPTLLVYSSLCIRDLRTLLKLK